MNMPQSFRAVALTFLVLSVFALAAGPTLAAPKKQEAAAPMAEPHFDRSGRFAFCLSSYSYPDKRVLSIARSRKEETNLGLTIPGGGFTVGEQYDLDVALPPAPSRKIRAVAMDPNGLLLQLGGASAFYNALGSAEKLTATAGGHSLSFDLPGIGARLKALESCVAENRDKTGKSAPQQSAGMPETLLGILISAGVKPLVQLDMSKIPPEHRPADYAWQTGGLLGGMREMTVPADKTLAELMGLYLEGLKKKCAGAFMTTIDREKKAPGLTLATALATCSMKNEKDSKEILASVLFFLTDTGRFTVFTHEGAPDEKDRALAIRNALADGFYNAALESHGNAAADGKKQGK
jgi:hypothetical protein